MNSLGYYELKNRKPWFDKWCSKLLDQRKQDKLQCLQDPSHINVHNLNSVRGEACRHFRNKSLNIWEMKLICIERLYYTFYLCFCACKGNLLENASHKDEIASLLISWCKLRFSVIARKIVLNASANYFWVLNFSSFSFIKRDVLLYFR
jgi:hypothetical protein